MSDEATVNFLVDAVQGNVRYLLERDDEAFFWGMFTPELARKLAAILIESAKQAEEQMPIL